MSTENAASAAEPNLPAELAGHLRTMIAAELQRIDTHHDWTIGRVSARITAQGNEPAGETPNAYTVVVERSGSTGSRAPYAVLVLAVGQVIVRRGSFARQFPTTDGMLLPIHRHIRDELVELVRKTTR